MVLNTSSSKMLGAILMGLLALAGCGSQMSSGSDPSSESLSASAPASAADSAATSLQKSGKNVSESTTSTSSLIESASAVPRKIIYNATVTLIAESFATTQRELITLVKSNGGYVAETNVDGTPGTPRKGTWKVRIPASRFETFLGAVSKLGELQSTETDSQDVTAEFYDLQARISNKQVEEKRLIQHLQRSTAKLSDILQVERELSRVRGEIEEMQGRLRLLANMTSLSTVTVSLQEVKGYVPPKPTGFGSEVGRTLEASLDGMKQVGKALVLVFVGIFPWVIAFVIVGVPVWLVLKRFANKP
ncbi:DUF4349 domain-containing protein [bacterium]|nr:MAG: DUF4349 domain-containing protein [bacterium]